MCTASVVMLDPGAQQTLIWPFPEVELARPLGCDEHNSVPVYAQRKHRKYSLLAELEVKKHERTPLEVHNLPKGHPRSRSLEAPRHHDPRHNLLCGTGPSQKLARLLRCYEDAQ